VTVARFEYEYLTGRAESVRAAADKKVAAAGAWVEALRAGEKVMAMRGEVIEKEIEEATAGAAASSSTCVRSLLPTCTRFQLQLGDSPMRVRPHIYSGQNPARITNKAVMRTPGLLLLQKLRANTRIVQPRPTP
jgi:hypothetical protein